MNSVENINLQKILTFSSFNYDINFYHSELLRIYNILKNNNSLELANKIKHIIFIHDYNNGTVTNFKTQPFKGDIRKLTLSQLEYKKYKLNIFDLNEKMDVFYNE